MRFFALNTFLWAPNFGDDQCHLIRHVKELGADMIELQRSGFDDFPVDAVRRQLELSALDCTLCTSPPTPELSLISENPEARRHAVGYLRRAIAVARDLGTRLISAIISFTHTPP